MDCVVLAGGRPGPGDSLWAETRGCPKALIDLAGRPMIRWVLDALAGSTHIDRIIVVGLDNPLDSAGDIEFLVDQGSLIGNLYAGIGRLGANRPAAYCWSDIPLVTTPMLDRFIEATPDTPFFQIGEHKYGKPILDRVARNEMKLGDAAKMVLLSFDSTLRSNLSVGLPIDMLTYETGSLKFEHVKRIGIDDPYFKMLSSEWSKALRTAFANIEPFDI